LAQPIPNMSEPSRPDRHEQRDPCEANFGQPAAQPRELTTERMIDSDALFAGRSQLAIKHNETVYFLRQTRFGKLILTK